MSDAGVNTKGRLKKARNNTDYMFDMLNAEETHQETGGTFTADGTEQNIIINNAPLGVFKPRFVYLNLDNMAAGDTIEVKEYYRIASAGNLELIDVNTYTGADGGLLGGRKLIRLTLSDNRYGMKVTLQQTAGVNRDYTWEYFEEA